MIGSGGFCLSPPPLPLPIPGTSSETSGRWGWEDYSGGALLLYLAVLGTG